MKKTTKLLALLLAVLMVMSIFAGCSSKEATTDAPGNTTSTDKTTESGSEATGDREFVELNFYIMNSPVTDQERVMEKANAIIEEAINAHLNIVCIDPGTYAEKINLMINSGEEFDLCFMANWGDINFFENASKGAFVSMNDLLPTYAPRPTPAFPKACGRA